MSRIAFILLVAGAAFSTCAAPAQPQTQAPKQERVGASLLETKRDAEAGNAKAQKLFADSFKSLSQFAAAEHWYRASAVQGEADALYELAMLYQSNKGNGTNFVKGNVTNAIVLHRLAALQGDPKSHLELFVAYKTGNGVPRDSVQAYKHLLLSDKAARDSKVKEMILSMSNEQITQAENEAKVKPITFEEAFREIVFQSIKMGGTMGGEQDRVAFLNGAIVARGGMLKIQVGGLPAVVKCVAVAKDSVTVSFNSKERVIAFARPTALIGSPSTKRQ